MFEPNLPGAYLNCFICLFLLMIYNISPMTNLVAVAKQNGRLRNEWERIHSIFLFRMPFINNASRNILHILALSVPLFVQKTFDCLYLKAHWYNIRLKYIQSSLNDPNWDQQFFFPPWHKNSANVWVATVAATWFPSSCLSGLTHFSSLSSPHNPMCMPSLYTRVNLLPPPGCCLAKQLLMPQGMSENKMCIVCRS